MVFAATTIRKQLRRFGPGIERLEERTVPSGLTVTVNPNQFLESSGTGAALGSVFRTGDLSASLTVSLSSSDSSEATVPNNVVIPAGQASATFPVDAVDDLLMDGTQIVDIAASATQNQALSFLSFYPFAIGNISAIAVQPDGKVVAVGGGNNFLIARFNANGTTDLTFGRSGVVSIDVSASTDFATSVLIQPDGKVLVGGYGSLVTAVGFGMELVRLNPDGSPDLTFSGDGKVIVAFEGFYNEIWDLALQPDGKILAAGTVTPSATGNDFGLVRFNTDGTVDRTFGGGAGYVATDFSNASERAFALAVQADGKIVLGGQEPGSGASSGVFALARYNPDGTLDPQFGVDGKVSTDFSTGRIFERVNDLLLYPDGRILVVGQVGVQVPGGVPNNSAMVRYLPNGAIDPQFGLDGRVETDISFSLHRTIGSDTAEGVALQPDGRILVTGGQDFNTGQGYLARYSPDGRTLETVLATRVANGSRAFALGVLPNGDVVVGGYNPNSGSGGFLERYSAFTPLSGFTSIFVQDNDPNFAPIARDDSYDTREDVILSLGPPGVLGNDSDPENQPLRALLVTPPRNGTLVLNGSGSFIYRPNSNYSGTDQFSYKVTDGDLESNVATVTIVVSPVNDRPEANSQSVTTAEDTAVLITLAGSDVDGDPLQYVVVSGPSHGTLSGSGANRIYTPAQDYNGPDSFTFGVTDGELASSLATVSIRVTEVNDAPNAGNDSVQTDEDTPLRIPVADLLANDRPGPTNEVSQTLTLTAVGNATLGTVTLEGGVVTFTPSPNLFGVASFSYTITDNGTTNGTDDPKTATGTVTVGIISVNDPPIADGQTVTTNEDTAAVITLTGSDIEGDALTYTVVNGPAHGTLSGTAPNLTYTPATDYNGSDSFTFKVNDGSLDSAVATVQITIRPVNDEPVANGQSVTTLEDSAASILLSGNDVDGDTLAYTIVNGPSRGTLSGTAPNLTYTPAANYNGADSFTFKVNDGSVDSNIATVQITIRPVNDAPVADGQSVTTLEDSAASILLSGNDVDGDTLTYTIVNGPTHGTLSGTAPNLTYTPGANYNGSDSFTFKVNDGSVDSNIAMVQITIRPVNDAPVANGQSVTTLEDSPVGVTLTGSDLEGDPLTYTIVNGPSRGTLSGTAPNLTYTPAANYNGSDSFTFRVNDGSSNSNIATVQITVRPVNDVPVARGDSYTTSLGTLLRIAAPGVLGNDLDVDGDTLRSQLVSAPTQGTLTLNADGSFSYLPSAGYTGADTFTYRAIDGQGAGSQATVSLTVLPLQATTGKLNGSGRIDAGVRKFEFNIDSRLVNGVLAFSGQLKFEDMARGIVLRSTAITSVRVEDDEVRATFSGTATVNGQQGYTFRVNVADRGEPGRQDTFQIQIFGPGGYAYDSILYALANGLLEQGNLQVRRR